MQPTSVLDIQRSGDLGGHKVAMKFDQNSIAHIMSVLTDLYSDAEMAIIREYSTNAWDSHVEVGNTQPINIYTPSNLSPFFRVKDYGVGMDLDDIENIYSQYGASTKRGTNEQTGMLGLGCKSALTYTNQFTLVAIKNGVKTSVMISRVEDGTGVMEVLFQKPTDEPNGVEVVIPVRWSSTFEAKVNTFFSYWKPGTVKVNDREPVRAIEDAKKIGKTDIYMVNGVGADMVVMGNVAYPLNSSSRISADWNGFGQPKFHLIAFVPIGDINFTPSREALNYETSTTKATLMRLRQEFSAAIKTTIGEDIETAVDRPEAIRKYYQWQDMLPRMGTNYMYKGKPIELTYKSTKEFHTWNRGAYRYAMDTANSSDYKQVMATLTVYNFDVDKKVTPTMRKKVEQWMNDVQQKFQSKVFFTEEVLGSPWTDGSPRVDFATIQAMKLPKNANPRAKRVAKYDVLNIHGRTEETDEIDDSKNIYYCSPVDWKNRYKLLVRLFPDDVVVSIGKNRFDKFKRDFPNAVSVESRLRPRLSQVRDMLEPEDLMWLSLDNWSKVNIARFEADKFDDPALKSYVKAAASKPSDRTTLFQTTVSTLNSMGFYSWSEMEIPKRESPFKAYPLVGNVNDASKNAAHVYMYCNAVFNSKEK